MKRARNTRHCSAAGHGTLTRDIGACLCVCVFIAGDWFQLEGAFSRLLGWRLKLCAQLLSRLSEPGTQREPDAPQVLHLLQLFSQHARRRMAWCPIIGMMASPERWVPAASPLTIHVGRRSCAPAFSQPLRRGAADNAHPPHAAAAAAAPPAARPLEPPPDLQFDQIDKRPRMLLSLCLRAQLLGLLVQWVTSKEGGGGWHGAEVTEEEQNAAHGAGSRSTANLRRIGATAEKRSEFSLLFSHSSR